MTPFEFLAIVEHPELADHTSIRGMRFLSPIAEWVTDKVFASASDARWWVTHEMNYSDMCHAMWLEDASFQAEYERRNRTAFCLPEHLTSKIEHLGADRYHLFVNGRWTYAFYSPHMLMEVYREFEHQGEACTVVAAGEIVFYCRHAELGSEARSRRLVGRPSLVDRQMLRLHIDEEKHR